MEQKNSILKRGARAKFNSGKSYDSATNPLHGKVQSMMSNHPLERSTSPPIVPAGVHGKLDLDKKVNRPPLLHTVSTPNMELPKTYISVASYTSQAKECLSFSEGDKCVLIQQSPDGWWLVNIGGREGWTPGEYWKEDSVSLIMEVAGNSSLTVVVVIIF